MAHPVFPITVTQIADRDHLYECYQENKRDCGQTPGEDRVTYAALSNSEVGEIVGELSNELLDGSYLPGKARNVQIPKTGKPGHRTLKLGNIIDRAVNRAVYKTLEPFWEREFLPCSFGFRRSRKVFDHKMNRDTWTMLAELEVSMVRHNRWVVAIDDVKSAFDNVPIIQTLECHRQLLATLKLKSNTASAQAGWQVESERIIQLVDVVLRGADQGRKRGIEQGNNYSPIALNALLHYRLDKPMSGKMKHPFWFRYAEQLGLSGPKRVQRRASVR